MVLPSNFTVVPKGPDEAETGSVCNSGLNTQYLAYNCSTTFLLYYQQSIASITPINIYIGINYSWEVIRLHEIESKPALLEK